MTTIPRRLRPARGFSLLEVMMSLLMVSVLLVAVVNTIGAISRGRQVRDDLLRAKLLAQDLMEEIAGLAYEEPFELVKFGPEVSEGDGTRAAFDDVDDYHGWNDAAVPFAPQRRDGSPLPGVEAWARTVTVETVTPANPEVFSGEGRGVKRITVRVLKDGVVRDQLVTLRTHSFKAPPYD